MKTMLLALDFLTVREVKFEFLLKTKTRPKIFSKICRRKWLWIFINYLFTDLTGIILCSEVL
jgi:hypothetical protein